MALPTMPGRADPCSGHRCAADRGRTRPRVPVCRRPRVGRAGPARPGSRRARARGRDPRSRACRGRRLRRGAAAGRADPARPCRPAGRRGGAAQVDERRRARAAALCRWHRGGARGRRAASRPGADPLGPGHATQSVSWRKEPNSASRPRSGWRRSPAAPRPCTSCCAARGSLMAPKSSGRCRCPSAGTGDTDGEPYRALVRIPRPAGMRLARTLADAQAVRSAHKDPERLRVQVDPLELI